MKVVKNKVAPPFRTVDFDIMYGSGISREGEIIDIGVKYDFIEKSGSWFSYGDVRIGQGRENAKQYMKDNPAVAEELSEKIKTQLLNSPANFVLAEDIVNGNDE